MREREELIACLLQGEQQAPLLARLAPPGLRLLLFAGKGGVGKTSCAAATALALAARGDGDVLLMSTDPAPSLLDVLCFEDGRMTRGADTESPWILKLGGSETPPQPPVLRLERGRASLAPATTVSRKRANLHVLEVDAEALFARRRERYRDAVEWVHALLEILLKYRKVIGLGELGVDLVGIARDLRRLQALLVDPAQTRLVAVTRPAELPRLETMRLLRATTRLGLTAAAVLVNALTPPGCTRCRRVAAAEARALGALRRSRLPPRCAIIEAPAVAPPPRGPAALARWRATRELQA